MINNTRVISTASGRKLRIFETGQPDGMPVLVHHETPGSYLLVPSWINDANSHGIRLISYDRPGYGCSTPSPGRSVSIASEDVATIAKELSLDRLCVFGYSGGGPHALACAALLPDLVVAAAIIASFAPYEADGLDWFDGMDEANIKNFKTALDGRDEIEQLVKTIRWPWLLKETPQTLVNGFGTLFSANDAAAFSLDLAGWFLNQMLEGSKDRVDGWVDDYIAFTTPWDFEVDKIKIPVLLMHGGQDRFMSISHGEWLAEYIPNVDARLLADDGHITLSVSRIPEVYEWLMNRM